MGSSRRTSSRLKPTSPLSFLLVAVHSNLNAPFGLPYVDFSTAPKRLFACQRELELNRRTAPAIYRAVRRITREANGSLGFDGQGPLVDAVVEMVRFDEETLFDRMAARGALTPAAIDRNGTNDRAVSRRCGR